MATETIIRHIKGARQWLDQALLKYQQGENHAGYWDVSLAEAELKLARQAELASAQEDDQQATPDNVVSITMARGWRMAMKVSTAAAACLVFGFLSLHWSDYSLKLLSPREALSDAHPAAAPTPKFLEKIYIAAPSPQAARPAEGPRVAQAVAVAPAPTRPQQAAPATQRPHITPAPKPFSRPQRPQSAPRQTGAATKPVKPASTPVTAPKPAPAPKAPVSEPAPKPAPKEEAAPAPAETPVVKPTPAPKTSSKPKTKGKPKVDYLDLLREAENQLR